VKINKVYVEMRLTRSANYQSTSTSIGLGADLAGGDDADRCVQELQAHVKKLLTAKVEAAAGTGSAGNGGAAQENKDILPQHEERN
jgi:hypothetical protein